MRVRLVSYCEFSGWNGDMNMKAMVNTEYGTPDVLRMQEVARPTPKAEQVLVRVHAASLNTADYYLLKGEPVIARLMSGIRKPKNIIAGTDFAGTVVEVGAEATRFRVGDAVFGDLSGAGFGAFGEYAAVPEKILALKPKNLSFEEAAAVPMACCTAFQGLRQGKIQAGERVLIYGASGGVGTFALQLAKAFGAHVTAVCSTGKVALARELGADRVLDYTREDFLNSGEKYDLILAANGKRSLMEYRRGLKPAGRYVMTGGAMSQIFQALIFGPVMSIGSKKMSNLMAAPSSADLSELCGIIEAGKVTPVIDRCYPLAELREAFQYLSEGHARGKVVISVADTSDERS